MMVLNKSPDKIVLIYEGLFPTPKTFEVCLCHFFRDKEHILIRVPPVYSWVYTYITFSQLVNHYDGPLAQTLLKIAMGYLSTLY